MRSKALLSKSAQLKAFGSTLPTRIADLDGCELISHCDGCGRHFQLYPGHADFDSRMKLAGLLERLVCSARLNGRVCRGLPRRLVLVRDEHRWVLEASGEWREDDSAFWEASDFEARAESHAAF
jgi:hypothetical protein